MFGHHDAVSITGNQPVAPSLGEILTRMTHPPGYPLPLVRRQSAPRTLAVRFRGEVSDGFEEGAGLEPSVPHHTTEISRQPSLASADFAATRTSRRERYLHRRGGRAYSAGPKVRILPPR
jgi:hypothetical protein